MGGEAASLPRAERSWAKALRQGSTQACVPCGGPRAAEAVSLFSGGAVEVGSCLCGSGIQQNTRAEASQPAGPDPALSPSLSWEMGGGCGEGWKQHPIHTQTVKSLARGTPGCGHAVPSQWPYSTHSRGLYSSRESLQERPTPAS